MHFYDCSTAPSPRRARMFIAEKGLDIPTTEVSIAKGEQMADDFRKINPFCTLPALVTDDGVTLTQNIGIATYLEQKFPEPVLMGRNPAETGEIMDWAAIAEQQGGMATAEALRNSNPHMKGRALPGPDNYEQIPELAERGLARAKRFQEMMEAHMTGRDWVVGDAISYADITAFVLIDFQRIIKVKVDETKPALNAWYTKMKDRPSAQL
ncbi:MAG: glutathione S-transferase family protein [Minwuia sp.]|uniref:glutathione S-transferase family protein n=1 Tax=Minwuia sp. TaxID=2493630 RepID=UPI003A8C13C2